jgi:hypothetical protein
MELKEQGCEPDSSGLRQGPEAGANGHSVSRKSWDFFQYYTWKLLCLPHEDSDICWGLRVNGI